MLAVPYVPVQRNTDGSYQADQALARGTLFPGLDLPYRGMVNEAAETPTPLQELMALGFAVQELGLYNSFWVMVVPFSVSAYNVIVARTVFETSLPPDLWDAAQIDGCGNLRFFFTIALPLSKAVVSVIALWTAVGQWNCYFNALIYIRDERLYPLALIMRNILVTQQIQSALGTGEAALIALRKANLMRYAMIIVATVPIMCVYPFVQKYFDQGVMIGAVKG